MRKGANRVAYEVESDSDSDEDDDSDTGSTVDSDDSGLQSSPFGKAVSGKAASKARSPQKSLKSKSGSGSAGPAAGNPSGEGTGLSTRSMSVLVHGSEGPQDIHFNDVRVPVDSLLRMCKSHIDKKRFYMYSIYLLAVFLYFITLSGSKDGFDTFEMLADRKSVV